MTYKCYEMDKEQLVKIQYVALLHVYRLLKISLFIGPKRPRGKSSNCHINWLARAGRSLLVTKFRADVLVPLSHRAAHNQLISFHCLALPRSILAFSGRYHIISNASKVINCIILRRAFKKFAEKCHHILIL